MRELRLVGLSADGRQVLFVDDSGAQFATAADDRLRAALRGDRPRLGQLEIEMDSALRPRDIQARIRSGDSPETVAALAQVPLERVMPYCIPVLAERQHIAELARRSHVRRKGVEAASRGLGEVVHERLRTRGIDPHASEWDAWRRDDGRWEVQVSYLSGESHRSALFIFDAIGRYSLPEDDEAKWLTGEPQSTSKGPQPRDGGRPGDRRLAAVPDEDAGLLPLADDASDDLTAVARAVDESDGEQSDEPDEPGEPVSPDAEPEAGHPESATESPLERSTDTPPDDSGAEGDKSKPAITSFLDQALSRHQKPARTTAKAVKGNAGAPTEPTPERKRRSRRASVPSWDEIMFGKDDQETPPE